MSNMYDILGKLKNLMPGQDKPAEVAKEPVYESVEPRGDIMEAVKNLEEKYMGFKKTVAAVKKGGSAEDPEAVAAAIGRKKYGKEKFQKAAAAGKKLGEAAKPDYIDLDKDGDKKESMKKAAKDAKAKKAVKEGEYDPAPIDPEAVAKRKRLQALKDKQEADRAEHGSDHKSSSRFVKGKAYGGAAQKDDADDELNEYSQAEYDQAMADFKAKGGKAKQLPPGSAKNPISTASRHIAGRGEAGKGKTAGRGAKIDPKGKPVVDVYEKAPPGAKAERMVKHIKQGYAKDGKLTKKEKGIAYATAWKAHNKGQVEEGVEFGDTIKNSEAKLTKAKPVMVKESRMIQEGDYFYEKLGKALAEKNPTLNTADSSFVTAVRQEMVAQGMEPNRARNIIMTDEDFISDVASSYAHYCQEIAECGAPMNSLLGGTTVEQELDEIARLAGLPVEENEVYNEVNMEESPDTMDEGNAFTGKLAATRKGEKFELGGKEFTDTSDLGESALEEEEMGEGNEFSGALAKAKAAGEKEFEVDGKKYTVKEDINVNISATGEEDALNLIRKLSGMPVIAVAAHEAEPVVDMTSEAEAVEEDRDIEYVNTPREQVAPLDAAIPSGTDLHKSKEQYKKEYPGDNPMAVKEEVEDSLWKRYNSMIKTVKK